MRGDDADSFEVIGSGTLVVRNGQYGVLTAHHCLHAWDPPVKLGRVGEYRIFFIAKNGHMPSAMQHELAERPLGVPKRGYCAQGPDLTFIRIPPGPVLEALKGYASFCPLNRRPEEIARRFCVDRAYLANLGYPAHGISIRRAGKNVRADVTLMVGAGALRERDIERSRGWDYVNCFCDYRAFPHLPAKWNGMSGGGIWTVLFSRESDRFDILDYALVGVMFYQTPTRGRRCRLRGHFVRSIYSRGWRTRGAAT